MGELMKRYPQLDAEIIEAVCDKEVSDDFVSGMLTALHLSGKLTLEDAADIFFSARHTG